MSTRNYNCAYCGDANATSKCSRCKTTHYCGKGCQSIDWKRHKKEDCRSPDQSHFEAKIAKLMAMGEQSKAVAKRNRGVIIEVHNCAEFLAAANGMIGKEGPACFDFEIKEDVASAEPANVFDMQISANISKHILGVPIGQKGVAITLDDIVSMLRGISEKDNCIKYSVYLLLAASGMLGKKGPCYLEHGIVTASNKDASLDGQRLATGSSVVKPGAIGSVAVNASGELKKVLIGNGQKRIAMDDIISAFYKVSTHVELEKFRKSGRSYFHEGFKVSGNGKTLSMLWGS